MTKASAPVSVPHHYAIALGSNRLHARHGRPGAIIAAAIEAMAALGIGITRLSPTIQSAPIGPAHRRFANAAALITTPLDPPALLALLKAIEYDFGRRTAQRWGDRVLDLDIILWSGGAWNSRSLTIPHPHWRTRDFVLEPLSAIAPHWRDPVSGRRVRHWQAISQKGRI